jgi:Ala-tRNA(Pro) deacylase
MQSAEMTSEHPIAHKIVAVLTEHKYWYKTFEHAMVRTSEDAALVRPGYSLEQGAKALIVRLKIPNEGKRFVMLVMPAHQKFDASKVKALTGSKDIRFATESEVESITDGVKPGGVPPFGNLFSLPVLADGTLFDQDKIIFNAGRTVSIAMKSADYKKLVQPLIASII